MFLCLHGLLVLTCVTVIGKAREGVASEALEYCLTVGRTGGSHVGPEIRYVE
jgi:hypothetical protein